jgi:hypothetical protein
MALNHEDKDRILDLVGYTPEQKELAAYMATNLLKRLVAEKYQDIKTTMSLSNKKQLEALAFHLLIENRAITQIIVHNVNQELKK